MNGMAERARLLAPLFLSACFVALLPGVAHAATETDPHAPAADVEVDETRPTSIGHWAYGRLDRANAALAEGDYERALAALDEMNAVVEMDRRSKRREKLNAYERGMMWQTYGYVRAGQERYPEAIEAFEHAIAEQGLPLAVELGVRSNMAQLYLGEGDYPNAIKNFELWFGLVATPTPEAQYMLAMAYALSGDKQSAVPYAEAAVASSEAPQEGRLQLLASLYFDQGRFEDVERTLRLLLTYFPSKKYWMQLSAIYAELGRYDLALAVQEAMFEQHLLTEHREYVTLAQLYLNAGVPYEAAIVLEAGLDAGAVEDAEEGWDLLAMSYLQAREYERALPPLERAASLAVNGRSYLRLGEVYLGEQRWADARNAFAAALAKGGLDDPGEAHVLLGIANASDQRFDDATRAFAAAESYPSTASMAKQWIAHVEQQRQLAADEAEHVNSRESDSPGEPARYARAEGRP
jgi:tetratricopeptide (TPR) repeat protein